MATAGRFITPQPINFLLSISVWFLPNLETVAVSKRRHKTGEIIRGCAWSIVAVFLFLWLIFILFFLYNGRGRIKERQHDLFETENETLCVCACVCVCVWGGGGGEGLLLLNCFCIWWFDGLLCLPCYPFGRLLSISVVQTLIDISLEKQSINQSINQSPNQSNLQPKYQLVGNVTIQKTNLHIQVKNSLYTQSLHQSWVNQLVYIWANYVFEPSKTRNQS